MAVATLENLEKTFGRRVLFDKLSLAIHEGERIGLVGDNGSGKSSLFKALIGELVVDAGAISVSKGVRIGHLEQDPVFNPENTVVDEAELAFAELHRLSHLLRELEHEMAHLQGDALDKILEKYQNAQHEFDLAGGYAWQHRLEATLLGVGLDRSTWEQNVTTLSGGQRSRLALVKLLISEPDLLLLDEPTNHLDLVAVEWLENFLLKFSGAILLISHDRFLLDRVANRIAWLHDARVDSFKGNYSAFVEQRKLIELSQQRAYDQQQEMIAKEQEFVRRFSAGQRAKEARGRKTRLERLLISDSMVDSVKERRGIHLSISTDKRAGDMVLEVRGLSKAYGGRQLWDDISVRVVRGERIGVIGPNGAGKTTLLETLLGQRDADSGELRWGASLQIGYYDQRLGEFDPDASVFEEARQGRDIPDQDVRNTLALMLFRGQDIEKPMGMLSGGERARVRLVQLLLDKPNVLVLDEPTNHLDIASREALENALETYNGTILCVSHDRYFLDRAARRLWVLEPPRIRDFEGNYSAFAAGAAEQQALADRKEEERARAQRNQEKRSQEKRGPDKRGPDKRNPDKRTPSDVAAAPRAARSAHRPPVKKDNPYARPFGRLSVEQLEHEIAKSEAELRKAQAALADPATFKNPGLQKQLDDDYQRLTDTLAGLEEEYFARGA